MPAIEPQVEAYCQTAPAIDRYHFSVLVARASKSLAADAPDVTVACANHTINCELGNSRKFTNITTENVRNALPK